MFLPRKSSRARFLERLLQNLRAFGELPADVNVREVRTHREAGDHHPLDQLMRILVNDVAILERAGLRFVRVADEISRLRSAGLDEAPLHAARKTRAAASAQAGLFFTSSTISSRLHLERLLQLLVAAVLQVALDVVRPALAIDVLENEPLLRGCGAARVTSSRRLREFSTSRRFLQRDVLLEDASSTIATGADPQLARHSTNSMLNIPRPALTRSGAVTGLCMRQCRRGHDRCSRAARAMPGFRDALASS